MIGEIKRTKKPINAAMRLPRYESTTAMINARG
jgi:hypothetical protein